MSDIYIKILTTTTHQFEYLLTIYILFIDEYGKIYAELLSVIDIILHKLCLSDIQFGEVCATVN